MKIIPEFPNYRIFEDGRVESNFKFKTNIPCDTWRAVKPIYDKSCGYMIVTLCSGTGIRKNKRLHRLLCEAFKPNPEDKKHVNHINGIKLDNSLTNLEWSTEKENAQHAVDTGLCDAGRIKQEVKINQFDLLGVLSVLMSQYMKQADLQVLHGRTYLKCVEVFVTLLVVLYGRTSKLQRLSKSSSG